MGKMYKVVTKGNKTVQTYAGSIQEAIDKVVRSGFYKVDFIKTKELYEKENKLK